jgi:fatty-acyl-CoA synthase
MSDDQLLHELIAEKLATVPNSAAFFEREQSVSYRQFDMLIREKEVWLRHLGVTKGDIVALWMVNSIEWLALYFGLSRIGAILEPINTRFKSHEVSYILGKAKPQLLIMQPRFRSIDFVEIFNDVRPEDVRALEQVVLFGESDGCPASLHGIPVIAATGPPEGDQILSGSEPDPNAASILFSTSGTTSGPKLVMQTQSNLVSHAHYCAQSYGLDLDGAALLAVLPFCGAFGLNAVLAAIAGGCPIILMDAFDGPKAVALVRNYGISHIFGSDELYRKLIDSAPGDKPFPNARLFGFGAFTSSFDDYALAAWERGIPLLGLYGSSEVMAIFSAQRRDMPAKQRIEGGGLPAAGARVTIRIRDTESGELMAAGESGEIEIASPTNFIGYLNDPAATTKAVLKDGYFRTGDLGYLREDGSLVYLSRMGDAIRLGGFLVSPSEIEAVIKGIPGVLDAYIVAVEIDNTPRVVAFVHDDRSDKVDQDHVIEAAKLQLAAYKVPYRVWFVDEYPVTQSANGLKVQRGKLREMAEHNIVREHDEPRA